MGPRGSGSRGRPAAAPDAVTNPQLMDLPAADLVGHLIRSNSRATDFVDVALVLAARERRLEEAEAQVRAADEVTGRLRDEIAAQDHCAAEAGAQIRLAAEREARLQAEIRAWQRRAAEAEARLLAYVDEGPDRTAATEEEDDDNEQEGREAEIGAPRSLKRAGAALPAPVLQAELRGHRADVVDLNKPAQAEEGAPLLVVSSKRKESMVPSEDKAADEDDGRTISRRQGLKKLKMLPLGRCSNAVSESEANTRDEVEAKAEEGRDLLDPLEIGNPEERTRTEPKHGNADMSVEEGYDLPLPDPASPLKITGILETGIASEHEQGVGEKVAKDDADARMLILQQELEVGGEHHAAVAPAGNELPPNNNGVEKARTMHIAAGGQEPEVPRMAAAQGSADSGDEPESGVLDTEVSPAAAINAGARSSGGMNGLRKKGMHYKMVFRALKENEQKLRALAKPVVASQPSLTCMLYAPLPKEPVAVEGGPDDKYAPQQ